MIHFGANLQIIAIFFAIGRVASQFNYCNQGFWIDKFGMCAGTQQSPIELSNKDVSPVNKLQPLKFVNYDALYNIPATVQNNGVTVIIQLPQPIQFWPDLVRYLPHITGGALGAAKFIPDNVHFHWGSTNAHGSEHVVNDRRFAMEMHIVHRNIKYPTLEEALRYTDGLAVISVMHEVVPTISVSIPLSTITNVLSNIRFTSNSTTISNFNLIGLVGSLKNRKIYTYSGSLTTPPCAEVVTWQVLSGAIQMSYTQIEAFRALKDVDGNKLENNYRGLQAKGNRQVEIVHPLFTRASLFSENELH